MQVESENLNTMNPHNAQHSFLLEAFENKQMQEVNSLFATGNAATTCTSLISPFLDIVAYYCKRCRKLGHYFHGKNFPRQWRHFQAHNQEKTWQLPPKFSKSPLVVSSHNRLQPTRDRGCKTFFGGQTLLFAFRWRYHVHSNEQKSP